MTHPVYITAFYAFRSLDDAAVQAARDRLHTLGKEHGMRGLVLLAREGINGTVCGTPAAVAAWKAALHDIFGDMPFNDSAADELVFPRWFVKVRREIVTLDSPDTVPQPQERHLTPEEWDKALKAGDAVIIDARNTYETAIGMFENAVDPRLKNFGDFPEFVRTADIPKDKKVLMYCTGGIRCEKASREMERQGYTDVYQLKGGILNYLKRFPDGAFTGECFVFDKRVSVDGSLQPSIRYGRCPHCGDPGERNVTCARCNESCAVCHRCLAQEAGQTCSKDCRYHLRRVGQPV